MNDRYSTERPTTEYWIRLTEKYFDATTTPLEEEALASFLSTRESELPEFDEIKAVMGYFATARLYEKKKTAKKKTQITRAVQWFSTAAAITITATIVTTFNHIKDKQVQIVAHEEEKDTYIAYIDGKEYTDKEIVLEHMHHTMAVIGNTTKDNGLEEQLEAIFSISNK